MISEIAFEPYRSMLARSAEGLTLAPTRAEILADMRQRASVPVGMVGGRPVYPIMGGADDGDEPEDDDADEDGDEEADSAGAAEDEDDDDPVRLKGELAKTREALARSNAQAKKHRLEARKAKSAAAGTPTEDAEKAEKIRIEAREPLVKRLINTAARSALLSAGYQVGKDGTIPDTFLRLIDRDAVEVDDDGEIDGLDEQVADLKRDYPERFKRKRTGPGDTGKADREDSGGKALSASARQAAALARK